MVRVPGPPQNYRLSGRIVKKVARIIKVLKVLKEFELKTPKVYKLRGTLLGCRVFADEG